MFGFSARRGGLGYVYFPVFFGEAWAVDLSVWRGVELRRSEFDIVDDFCVLHGVSVCASDIGLRVFYSTCTW